MSGLAVWGKRNNDLPNLMERHEQLAHINTTLTEYAELLEQVSLERAELLKTVSELQLKNAELSVSKVLFAELEEELKAMRGLAEQANQAVHEKRRLQKALEEERAHRIDAEQEAAELRAENGALKGVITKLRKKTTTEEKEEK